MAFLGIWVAEQSGDHLSLSTRRLGQAARIVVLNPKPKPRGLSISRRRATLPQSQRLRHRQENARSPWRLRGIDPQAGSGNPVRSHASCLVREHQKGEQTRRRSRRGCSVGPLFPGKGGTGPDQSQCPMFCQRGRGDALSPNFSAASRLICSAPLSHWRSGCLLLCSGGSWGGFQRAARLPGSELRRHQRLHQKQPLQDHLV